MAPVFIEPILLVEVSKTKQANTKSNYTLLFKLLNQVKIDALKIQVTMFQTKAFFKVNDITKISQNKTGKILRDVFQRQRNTK